MQGIPKPNSQAAPSNVHEEKKEEPSKDESAAPMPNNDDIPKCYCMEKFYNHSF